MKNALVCQWDSGLKITSCIQSIGKEEVPEAYKGHALSAPGFVVNKVRVCFSIDIRENTIAPHPLIRQRFMLTLFFHLTICSFQCTETNNDPKKGRPRSLKFPLLFGA